MHARAQCAATSPGAVFALRARVNIRSRLRWGASLVAIAMLMAGAIGRAQGPDGTPATLTGELMVLVADDFRSGRSEVMHFVRDQRSGRTFRIRYEGDTPNRRNGSVVTVRGRASGSELYVLATATESSTGSTSASTAPISAEAISGDRKVAVIVANFRDQPLTCSV